MFGTSKDRNGCINSHQILFAEYIGNPEAYLSSVLKISEDQIDQHFPQSGKSRISIFQNQPNRLLSFRVLGRLRAQAHGICQSPSLYQLDHMHLMERLPFIRSKFPLSLWIAMDDVAEAIVSPLFRSADHSLSHDRTQKCNIHGVLMCQYCNSSNLLSLHLRRCGNEAPHHPLFRLRCGSLLAFYTFVFGSRVTEGCVQSATLLYAMGHILSFVWRIYSFSDSSLPHWSCCELLLDK